MLKYYIILTYLGLAFTVMSLLYVFGALENSDGQPYTVDDPSDAAILIGAMLFWPLLLGCFSSMIYVQWLKKQYRKQKAKSIRKAIDTKRNLPNWW